MFKLIKKKRLPFFDYLALGFIVLYTIAALTVSLFRYWQGQFYYFDFGILDAAIYQVAHFQQPLVDHFELSSEKVNIFATHFYPSIFLLSPLYWFTQRHEVLIVAQALSVGVALFFAYLIAKKLVKSEIARFASVFAFGGFVGLQNALISEVHDTTLAVLPLVICFWALTFKKPIIYLVSLFILLGFKESFFDLGIGLGIYIYLTNKKYLTLALFTIFISIIWGFVTIKFFIPYFSDGKYLYNKSEIPGNLIDLLKTLILPSPKLNTIFYSFLSFGFLPILFVPILPLIIGQFMERFLFVFPSRWGLSYHYSATLAPLLFMGLIHVFAVFEERKWKRFVSGYALVMILTVIVLHRFVLNGPLGLFYNADFYRQPQPVNNFSLDFPATAIIMTQNNLAIHYTHQDVRLLRKTYDYIKPDIVLLDLTPGQTSNSFYPVSEADAVEIKDKLTNDPNYPFKRKIGENRFVFSKTEVVK